jgi:steroid 5-alpha reductase family enzyme
MVNKVIAVKTTKLDFALITSAYILTLLVAVVVGYLMRDLHPVLTIFTADIFGTLVIYFFGRVYHNASFYDVYWSIAPLVISLFWIFRVSSNKGVTIRQIIVIGLVFIWGLRLTYNWVRQWQGLKHEDWRYQDLRRKYRRWFWLIELFGIEIMPTVLVFLACLSLYSALAVGERPLGSLDIVASVITSAAIVIETMADEQLRSFMLKRLQSGQIMVRGFWAYSRHPNYFGEVMFWWGLFFFGLAADPGYWWTLIGPVLITALFIFISIPLMEKRSLEKREGYEEIRQKIPALIPWFPKT